jgi:thioredoxin 1
LRDWRDNFKAEVIESDLPVLIDFWAPWCSPCRMIEPIVEEIAKEYEGKIKICKLNTDEAPEVAVQNQVISIPTLILFINGKEIKRIVGAVPKSAVVKLINQFI